ncbi:hypothetical protein TNCV_3938921 [Trichonephila clavipes]|nr:hypothetical protein TNCV_3938921 [Trichonephila clavipes]
MKPQGFVEHSFGTTDIQKLIYSMYYEKYIRLNIEVSHARERVSINVALYNYTKAFGDGPRHFEPWSSDEDDTLAATPSPNYHTNERTFALSIERHRSPTRWVFSGTGLELMTCLP